MTLPSELESSDSVLPETDNKTFSNIWTKTNVTRLEFHTMCPDGVDPAQSAIKQTASSAMETLRQEQVAIMEQQLIDQQQHAAQQIEALQREATESQLKWKDELENRIAIERATVVRTCEDFIEERARYFAEIESEVVKLGLAIAARILHREVNLDPLLLAGAVRVVLEKVADDSAIDLRVPSAVVESWQTALAADFESRIQVIGDDRMSSGDCILETKVGRVELGVKAQLDEIEKGFFDLLQRRPV